MKGKFILARPTVVKQSEEVSDWLELDTSCRNWNWLKFARRRYISIFETRKMKQTKNPPYINLSVRYRRLTTTLPKTRNIINCRNSYNKCDWKPCTLLARAATPLKYANARKVFSSQCFKVMVKFWRNFFRD